ncbi:uncharacterized protein LOC123530213 [Mercenaria mercenaria]|uniref:uncharacterized protein LOC123530213 n=1 Tax=Mercenaria mercenaria TaxID=6596 RepID=UPI00234EF36C|nr:uncharacterized protein LOC123530213 [Mercenaria mercenaria]
MRCLMHRWKLAAFVYISLHLPRFDQSDAVNDVWLQDFKSHTSCWFSRMNGQWNSQESLKKLGEPVEVAQFLNAKPELVVTSRTNDDLNRAIEWLLFRLDLKVIMNLN